MDKNKKNKLIMLTISTLAILIIVVGVSYAFFRFSLTENNQELVAGQIYMHYKEGQKQINISEAVPSSNYDENEYFEFTIDGKNTSNKDIWYAITLSYGDAPSDRDTKIEDKFLKFTLFEGANKVVDGACYKNLNNKKLWVNKIDKNTTEDVNITYKLYMWISDEVNIGDDGDYDINAWNNKVYASVKVNVVGDFTEKTIDKPDGDGPTASGLAATILDKAYTNTSELIAIDNDGNKCESLDNCDVREYRYIGPTVNNYIYLKDNNDYNETWRIIGLFKNNDESEWNLKVVRDDVLPRSYIPETYAVNGVNTGGDTKNVIYTFTYSYFSEGIAYWNKNDSGTELNRWEESGLQYFLNTDKDSSGSSRGYLSYLSTETKKLLLDNTYYLGTIQTTNSPYDTPKEAYVHERQVKGCAKGNSDDWDTMKDTDCNLWSGNAATWTGKVALMYPSDYGLSATDKNWTMPLYYNGGTGFNTSSVKSTTWMYSTMLGSKQNWFLSPSSDGSNRVAAWLDDGYIDNRAYVNSWTRSVRPVLYLSSEAINIDGSGTISNPYKIFEERKIDVKGLAKDILDKAYSNTSELIAVDKDGNKCENLSSCYGKIREYRYIGPSVNNYIYLKSNTNANEKWRIIGLFQNDEGTEWNLKVVRDEALPGNYIPETYTMNNILMDGVSKNVKYIIQYSGYYEHSTRLWTAYWNRNDSGTELNRWEESGLQYFLNTEQDDTASNKGFLSYLSSDTKALLSDNTYYLGIVDDSNDTPKNAYIHERKIGLCSKGIADDWDDIKKTDCYLWNGNVATWKGKVGLMYPSDYGFSATEENWSIPLYEGNNGTGFEDGTINSKTWMYTTMDTKSKWFWFISPSSNNNYSSTYLSSDGGIRFYHVKYVDYGSDYGQGVRPVLFLSSATTRIDGAGTSSSPYVILD